MSHNICSTLKNVEPLTTYLLHPAWPVMQAKSRRKYLLCHQFRLGGMNRLAPEAHPCDILILGSRPNTNEKNT
jgi:hypothetical protein